MSANDSHDQLINELKQVNSQTAERQVVEEIESELADFSDAQLERLFLLAIGGDGFHSRRRMAYTIPEMLKNRTLSTSFSESLASKLTESSSPHNYEIFDSIASLLLARQEQAPLSEKAIKTLLEALHAEGMFHRWAAIRALAGVSREHGLFKVVLQSLLSTLKNHDHQNTRSTIIKQLSSAAQIQATDEGVINTFINAALSDSYMTVRMDAVEALIKLGINKQEALLLSKMLSGQLTSPTYELWERTRGLSEGNSLYDRAAQALADLHSAPYPDHVLEAWVTMVRQHRTSLALSLLEKVVKRDQLPNNYRLRLLDIAARDRSALQRKELYKLFYNPDTSPLEQLLEEYATADVSQRIKAGYQLQVWFASKRITSAQVKQIEQLLLNNKVFSLPESEELRATASALLLMYSLGFESQEATLIKAVKRFPEDEKIWNDLIDISMLHDSLAATVMKFAGDSNLPPGFRIHLLMRLKQDIKSESALSDMSSDLPSELRQIISNEDHYYLIQSAASVLAALGESKPLKAVLSNRNNQSRALFIFWLALVLAFIVCFPVGIRLLVLMPLSNISPKQAVLLKVFRVSVWSALSFGVGVALLIGFIGFMGHNNAPPLTESLKMNYIAYAAMSIYLVTFVWILRRVRAARRIHG